MNRNKPHRPPCLCGKLVLAAICYLLSPIFVFGGPVYFPIAEMTGLTNDVTINVRAVNNPVVWNNRFYYLPAEGTNLTTTSGNVTNSFVPGRYTMTVAGLAQSWMLNVTNNTTPVSAADLSRGITVYSGIQSLTGYGSASVTNDSLGNYGITATGGSGGLTSNDVVAIMSTNTAGSATNFSGTTINALRVYATNLLDAAGNPVSAINSFRKNDGSDAIEDFYFQPTQDPWFHTNWVLSMGAGLTATHTNHLVVTNQGYGGELWLGKGGSNYMVNFYISRTNNRPVQLAEATARTFDLPGSWTLGDHYFGGGSVVIIIGNNPVASGVHGGPTLVGPNAHVIFQDWQINASFWTNAGVGNEWNGPNSSTNFGYVYSYGYPMFTNGLSTCAVRRVAADTFELSRDGFVYLWRCDGFTNMLAPTSVTFQHWPSPTNVMVNDIAFQKLRVSYQDQPKIKTSWTNLVDVPNLSTNPSASVLRWYPATLARDANGGVVAMTTFAGVNGWPDGGTFGWSRATAGLAYFFPVSGAEFGGYTNFACRILFGTTNRTYVGGLWWAMYGFSVGVGGSMHTNTVRLNTSSLSLGVNAVMGNSGTNEWHYSPWKTQTLTRAQSSAMATNWFGTMSIGIESPTLTNNIWILGTEVMAW